MHASFSAGVLSAGFGTNSLKAITSFFIIKILFRMIYQKEGGVGG
jgi:hypothetical protein